MRPSFHLFLNFHCLTFAHRRAYIFLLQLATGNVKIAFPHYDKSEEKIEETEDQLRRKITILRTRNGLQCEVQRIFSLLCTLHQATVDWKVGFYFKL